MGPEGDLPTVDAVTAYDRYAQRYDAVLEENRINAYMRRSMMRLQAETFGRGQHLLELGCGTGDEALELARRGCRILAIDPSHEMISVARRKAGKCPQGGLVEFRVGRSRDLGELLGSEERESFDGAFSSFALSYEPDLAPVRRALASAVKPGGDLLVAAMNRFSAAEWILSCASGRPRYAGRRVSGRLMHKVGSVRTPVFARTLRALVRGFEPEFAQVSARGLPVALPPAYMNRPLGRLPGLLRFLEEADSSLGGWPILRSLGDHTVLQMRRVS